LRALEAELRGEVPDGLRSLDDAALGDLANAIKQARRRQAQALAAAANRALDQIPRLLRGPIRRMFS
jgi:hypothetical protein